MAFGGNPEITFQVLLSQAARIKADKIFFGSSQADWLDF